MSSLLFSYCCLAINSVWQHLLHPLGPFSAINNTWLHPPAPSKPLLDPFYSMNIAPGPFSGPFSAINSVQQFLYPPGPFPAITDARLHHPAPPKHLLDPSHSINATPGHFSSHAINIIPGLFPPPSGCLTAINASYGLFFPSFSSLPTSFPPFCAVHMPSAETSISQKIFLPSPLFPHPR